MCLKSDTQKVFVSMLLSPEEPLSSVQEMSRCSRNHKCDSHRGLQSRTTRWHPVILTQGCPSTSSKKIFIWRSEELWSEAAVWNDLQMFPTCPPPDDHRTMKRQKLNKKLLKYISSSGLPLLSPTVFLPGLSLWAQCYGSLMFLI